MVPLEDKSDYYNTDIQGEEEQDFSKIEEEEEENIRSAALKKYSKKEHKVFLLNEYYKSLEDKAVLIKEKECLINSLFEIIEKYLIFGENQYLTTIKEYNEKRQGLFCSFDH